MFFIRENYITETCVGDYKGIDGEMPKMTSNVDKTCDGYIG